MEEYTTFAERIRAIKDMAGQLRSFAETLDIEAHRMEAAQSRFEKRLAKRTISAKPKQH